MNVVHCTDGDAPSAETSVALDLADVLCMVRTRGPAGAPLVEVYLRSGARLEVPGPAGESLYARFVREGGAARDADSVLGADVQDTPETVTVLRALLVEARDVIGALVEELRADGHAVESIAMQRGRAARARLELAAYPVPAAL